MRVKSFENLIFYIGVAAAVLAFGFFVLTPMLSKPGFAYSGIGAFSDGFLNLFSFKFDNFAALLVFGLYLVAIIALIFWFIFAIIQKSKFETFAKIIVSLVMVTLVFTLISSMFVVQVSVNGFPNTLYGGINLIEGHHVAKICVMASMCFAYLSLMCTTLVGFLCLGMTNFFGKDYRNAKFPDGECR